MGAHGNGQGVLRVPLRYTLNILTGGGGATYSKSPD